MSRVASAKDVQDSTLRFRAMKNLHSACAKTTPLVTVPSEPVLQVEEQALGLHASDENLCHSVEHAKLVESEA